MMLCAIRAFFLILYFSVDRMEFSHVFVCWSDRLIGRRAKCGARTAIFQRTRKLRNWFEFVGWREDDGDVCLCSWATLSSLHATKKLFRWVGGSCACLAPSSKYLQSHTQKLQLNVTQSHLS